MSIFKKADIVWTKEENVVLECMWRERYNMETMEHILSISKNEIWIQLRELKLSRRVLPWAGEPNGTDNALREVLEHSTLRAVSTLTE
jgi:hypothetical protein